MMICGWTVIGFSVKECSLGSGAPCFCWFIIKFCGENWNMNEFKRPMHQGQGVKHEFWRTKKLVKNHQSLSQCTTGLNHMKPTHLIHRHKPLRQRVSEQVSGASERASRRANGRALRIDFIIILPNVQWRVHGFFISFGWFCNLHPWLKRMDNCVSKRVLIKWK